MPAPGGLSEAQQRAVIAVLQSAAGRIERAHIDRAARPWLVRVDGQLQDPAHNTA